MGHSTASPGKAEGRGERCPRSISETLLPNLDLDPQQAGNASTLESGRRTICDEYSVTATTIMQEEEK